MERIEIFKLNDGKLCVEIYHNMNDENSQKLLKGEAATQFIYDLKREKIFDILENEQDKEVVLVYKNKIIRLNEYEEIMYKKGMRILKDNMKKFKETDALSKTKKKKIVRENKHVGKAIIATSIVTGIILSASLVGVKDAKLSNSSDVYETEPTSIVQLIEENIAVPYQEAMFPYVELEQEENIENSVFIDYEDRSETDKAYFTKNNYWDLIEKYSKMYGLDPNLVLAIATQERGSHSSVMDEGGATGLMQVQNEIWENQEKISYNFDIQDYETYYITPERIQDLEQNIRIGCAIFQECLQVMDYNIPAAIQCYNMGQGTMYGILNEYSMDTGKSVEEILNNPSDIGWLGYRDVIPYGDPIYLENVLSWMGDSSNITVLKNNGEEVFLSVSNNTQQKSQVIC